jgi:hypothetical protein
MTAVEAQAQGRDMAQLLSLVLCALVGLALAASRAAAYTAVAIGSFERPVDIRVAPGQPNFLFVVEQPGRIAILDRETRLPTPFLDIADLVLFGGEQGLLSLAFAPDYATSRRFYVMFVNRNGNVEIDEFLRSTNNPRRGLRTSRRRVLAIGHPDAGNHNGGQLQFGTDGLLYISVGDGGATATPGEPARRLSSLLGKVLRIDPRPAGAAAYRIPPGNPLVGIPGRDEIFAWGLRNPWRMTISGALLAIADVGRRDREEINLRTIDASRAANFGWPQYEGDILHDASRPGPGPARFPIHVYDHGLGRCVVIGGHIVRDPDLPSLAGRFLYGDFCTGETRSFLPDVAQQQAIGDAPLGVTVPGLTTFGKGFGGQVYMAGDGTIYRLEP